ncbi:MAG: pantoate--beta-alanine ligase [Magnetospirillum sp. WYHS-4]
MIVVRTVAELRGQIQAWRREGGRIGLVPTMGALHEGHLSLVRRARAEGCTKVAATVFVNPKQFGPNEDFQVYPRDEAGDAAKLESVDTDLMFVPRVSEMYPEGAVTLISVPGLGDLLEGEFRPGFFSGVATVVAKLLLQALPDVAVFGEKDYQQLQVIRRLVRDLDIPVEVVGGETLREPDGLAMSSRNAYLTPEERRIAPALNRTLKGVAERIQGGGGCTQAEDWARGELLAAGFRKVDYVTIRDAETLTGPSVGRPVRILAAACLGKARLIDNISA